MYNTSSVADFGTLVQLRNIVNRRNVVADPKENVNACDDFFTLVVTCHFLVVVMKKLGMSELDDIPTLGDFTFDSWMKSDGDRKSDLYHFCQEIITEHVHLSLNSTAADDIDDKVQSYANEVMGLGMLYLNYKDAIKEGDGPRVLNIWKYLLPIFKVSNRRNYSIEVLLTLYNCHFVYTPRQTKQLVWSRFVNTHGLPAKNIAADLHMEHLNRLCKETIKGLGANKTPVAITRIGKAMGPMDKVLQNFDDSVLYNAPSQKHKAASAEKDRNKIISQLRSVLSEHRNRSHSCFPNFQSISDRLNQKNLQKWITEHVESWQSSK